MKICNKCGDIFEGPGSYCVYHNPYAFSKPRKSYERFDELDSYPVIKYRTGHGNHRHLRKPYDLTDYDIYDDYDNYDSDYSILAPYNDTSLVPYNTRTALSPYQNQQLLNDSSNPTFSTAANTLKHLASQHVIDKMTFSESRNGTKSVYVSTNKYREQCSTCKQWFPDPDRLFNHKREFEAGCEVHRMCFTREDEFYHATKYRHDRCFVKGCGSVYRREGGWLKGVVKDHMKGFHQYSYHAVGY